MKGFKTKILATFLVSILTISFSCSQNQKQTPEKKKSKMETTENQDIKKKLTSMQYHVTQENGTERPFSGKYWDHFKKGSYHCIVCGTELFKSDTKFESGCGWPSFSDVNNKDNFTFKNDLSHGMNRTEVRCANCDAHLGHVFNDGPKPTGLRYCINSASIKFEDH